MESQDYLQKEVVVATEDMIVMKDVEAILVAEVLLSEEISTIILTLAEEVIMEDINRT